MKTKHSPGHRFSDPQALRKGGFALIATISIMLLLVLLAVGLLSLSTVATRSSTTSVAMQTARANARLALTIAIGELQKHAGPDQRVTASGGMLGDSVDQPNWTGVWSTQDDDSLPVWLVSGNEAAGVGDLDDLGSHPDGYQTPDASPSGDTIEIFKGIEREDDVTVPLVDVESSPKRTGRYGWWVSDEGSKARVDVQAPMDDPISPTDRLVRSGLPKEPNFAKMSEKLDVLSDHESDLNKAKLATYDSVDLVLGDEDTPKRFAHHLTAGGYGLPVNVVKGGMKTDLSVLFDSSQEGNRGMLENYLGAMPKGKSLERNGAPIYQFTSVASPEKFYLSSELADDRSMGVGPNWGNLYNYGKLWQHVRNGESKQFSFDPAMVSDMRGNKWAPYAQHNKGQFSKDEQHTNSSLAPILSVLQMGFRFTAKEAPIPGTDPVVMGYQIQLQMKPLVGFWNPYNVKLRAQAKTMQWALYPHIRVNADTTQTVRQPGHFFSRRRQIRTDVWMRENWLQGGGLATADNEGGRRIKLETAAVDFEPGEFRLFSVQDRADMERVNKLVPDWNESGGFDFDLEFSEASQGDGTYDQAAAGTKIVVPKGTRVFYGMAYLDDSVKPRTREFFGDSIFKDATTSYIQVGGGGNSHRIADIWQPMTESGRTMEDIQFENIWTVPEPVYSLWVKSGGFNGGSVPASSKLPVELIAASPYHIGTWRFFSRTSTEAMPAEASAGSQRLRSWVDSNPRFGPMNPAWDGSKTRDNQANGFHFISPFIGGNYTTENFDGGPRGRGLVAEGQSEFGSYPEAERSNGRYQGYGGLTTSQNGQNHVPLFDVPRSPLVSLGQFQHAQTARYGFEPAFPAGNSHASMHIPLGETFVDNYSEFEGFRMVDISHSINNRIWDDCFFSTIGADYMGGGGGLDESFPLDGLATGDVKLPNSRHLFIPLGDDTSIEDIVENGEDTGAKEISARIGIKGAFNVNSTSKAAWKAVLASMADFEFPVITSDGGETSWENGGGIRLPRFGHVMQSEGWQGSSQPTDPAFWNGFREISEDELDQLAENIVEEVRARGPFRSFADFVNRDPESSEVEHQRMGPLQAALDRSLNHSLTGSLSDKADTPQGDTFSDAIGDSDNTAAGYAGYLMQGDVLQSLAPVLSVRGDYFRVRAVGQATDQSGNVTATAACEAYVQRTAGYVDPVDEPHLSDDELDVEANEEFGRRFKIASFKWLDASEV